MIDMARLVASLKRHEGVRLKLYWDSAQPPRATIGVGHNLSDNGITPEICDAILNGDIAQALGECMALPWFGALDPIRANVIVELCFNIGMSRLLGFVHMIEAIKARDWARAAAELTNSTWAAQVGKTRADDLSNMLLYGAWP
jgi:lysozyme